MTRLSRKNQKLDLVNKGGMLDLFDNAVKEIYRINDEQYDYLIEVLSEEEEKLFVKENMTFSDKKQILTILQKYLK
jgi:hypothetical protein